MDSSGWIFGGVAIAVAAMALAVVLGHVDGSLALDAVPSTMTALQ